MKTFERHTTNFTIANIWEFYQYEKFNFDPEYQRNSDVWNDDKKSFLIDSIIKNFPLPPIFLHEFIDQNTGKTCYDVIDGKQRLQTIISFIENKISLPEDCSSDGFVNSLLDGKSFDDLSDITLSEYKKNFWQYELSIEFIETDDQDVIDNIFDRLNRNGEPLNAQELRNAQYHANDVYKSIVSLSSNGYLKKLLNRLDSNRKEDVEFCSELYFTLREDSIIDSNRDKLTALYEKYCSDDGVDTDSVARSEALFNCVISVLSKIIGDYNRYYIYSVSHLYAIWALAWQVHVQGTDVGVIHDKLPIFYTEVKDKTNNPEINEYIISMQQATKTQTSRLKRVNALLTYMGMKTL